MIAVHADHRLESHGSLHNTTSTASWCCCVLNILCTLSCLHSFKNCPHVAVVELVVLLCWSLWREDNHVEKNVGLIDIISNLEIQLSFHWKWSQMYLFKSMFPERIFPTLLMISYTGNKRSSEWRNIALFLWYFL